MAQDSVGRPTPDPQTDRGRNLLPVDYCVLGPLSARVGTDSVPLGGRRQRLALAMLLAECGRVVSIDKLIDGVWGDSPPERARHTLQAYVSELRRTVEDPIPWDRSGYVLCAEPDRIDSRRFERLINQVRGALGDDPLTASALLRQALELWHGDPYADLAYAEALQPEIRRLQQLRVVAIEERVEAELALGQHRSVAEELETLTREHPFRERLRAQHMLALYRSGRQAEALRAYQAARQVLAAELGIDPSPQLRDLEQQILIQDPVLDLAQALASSDGGSAPVDQSVQRPDRGLPYSIRGFELRELVGEGHLGSVFRAYQPSMGREVALRSIRPELANVPAFLRRFEVDARIVAGLEHPHIVSLFDYWRDANGTYLVMPWLAGGSLAAAIDGGDLSVPVVMRIVEQIGSALSYAHRQGVLHCNITPSNVMFDQDGNAYLADFHLAAAERSTPMYASTEEVHGLPLTPRSDVYQLGRLVDHALAGHRRHTGAPTRPLAELGDDVPAGMYLAIARATADDPSDRFAKVDDFVRELRRATGSDVVAFASDDGEEAAAVRNPYKGLRAFQESDADDFFGREALIGELVDAVGDHRLVAVVGPSGSGKSSLVRAGLLPVLRSAAVAGSQPWLITDMFPGSEPFEELFAALDRVAAVPTDGLLDELTSDAAGLLRVAKRILPDDGSQLLVVVDQLEELFSMVTDGDVRRLFLDSLVEATTEADGRVRVVVSLRADFFDRPLQFHHFGALMRAGLVAVPSPAPDGLARAVSGPARRVGLELEPGLAAEIVRDVEGQPGSLPLFQHALAELFDRRNGRLLTIDSYRETGGVAGALGKRAEELYQSLTRDEQDTAEQIFLRLVTVNETSEDSRRRVRQSELAAFDAGVVTVSSIVQRFGAHRLLTFDRDPVTRGGTVEVAHEALLTQWNRLRQWIDTRRDDLLLQRRLEGAVKEWTDANRTGSFLLSGGRLEHFEQWAASTDLTLSQVERDLLASSRTHEDAGTARRRRIRRRVVAGLTTVAVVAGTLAVVATDQQRRAERGERAALARELTSTARANLARDPELGLLLAVEALEQARAAPDAVGWDATAALHEALLATPKVLTVDGGGSVAWSPDGGRIVTLGRAADDRSAYVWDAGTGEELGALPGLGDPIDVAWSGPGDRIVVTYRDAAIGLWDADSHELIATIGDHRFGYMFPHLTPDGATLVASEQDETFGRPTVITVWDVETGADLRRFDLPNGTWSTGLSPDGVHLAVSEPETGLVREFELATGRESMALDHGGQADFIAYSPEGDRIATAGNEIRLWDRASGELLDEFPFPGGSMNAMEWSPDGAQIAASGSAGTYLIATSAPDEAVPILGDVSVADLTFSPDGRRIAGVAGDTRVWELAALSGGELATYHDDVGKPLTHATWTGDGRRVLVTSFDNGATTVFDAATGEVLDVFPNEAWWGITVRAIPSPDGRYIAVTGVARDDAAGAIGTTHILDAESLEEITVLDPGGIPGAFSEDSSLLMIGNFGAGHVYRTGSWEHVATLTDATSRTEGFYAFWDGHFLSDGRRLVTGDSGLRPGAAVWDISDWSIVGTVPTGRSVNHISASADGERLVFGNLDSGWVSVFTEEALLGGTLEAAVPIAEFDASDGLTSAVLSPDGSTVVTTSLTRELTFWDVDSGERMFTLDMGGELGEPTFSDDGRRLLVPVATGTIHLLSLDPDELIDLGRDRVTRSFTDEECRLYLHVDSCPDETG